MGVVGGWVGGLGVGALLTHPHLIRTQSGDVRSFQTEVDGNGSKKG